MCKEKCTLLENENKELRAKVKFLKRKLMVLEEKYSNLEEMYEVELEERIVAGLDFGEAVSDLVKVEQELKELKESLEK